MKNPCRVSRWGRGRRLSMAHHKSLQIHNSLEACEKDKTRCFGSLKTAFPQVSLCRQICLFACAGFGSVLPYSTCAFIWIMSNDECASFKFYSCVFLFSDMINLKGYLNRYSSNILLCMFKIDRTAYRFYLGIICLQSYWSLFLTCSILAKIQMAKVSSYLY